MILLNDILQLPNPKEMKLRFNLNFGNKRPAIDYFTDQTTASKKKMLEGQYWNYGKKMEMRFVWSIRYQCLSDYEVFKIQHTAYKVTE